MKKRGLLLILATLFLLPSCASKYEAQTNQAENIVLGNEIIVPFSSPMTLTLFQRGEMKRYFPAFNQAIREAHTLGDRYRAYPEINNLKTINDSYGTNREIIVDERLFSLLSLALDLTEITGGYFNPSIGPLTDFWRPILEKETTLIDRDKLAEARTCLVAPGDIKKIVELNEENNGVTFHAIPGCVGKGSLSLDAIAKGYALDLTSDLFVDTEALLDGGRSSMKARGINPRPDRDTWNIAILSPFGGNIGILALEGDNSFSTSGDYEQTVTISEKKYHHILNPETGESAAYYRSISLYAKDNAGVLDALSTALFNIDDFAVIKKIIEKTEEKYDTNIEILLEKETDDGKIDVYLTKEFNEHMLPDQWSADVRRVYLLDEIWN